MHIVVARAIADKAALAGAKRVALETAAGAALVLAAKRMASCKPQEAILFYQKLNFRLSSGLSKLWLS